MRMDKTEGKTERGREGVAPPTEVGGLINGVHPFLIDFAKKADATVVAAVVLTVEFPDRLCPRTACKTD